MAKIKEVWQWLWSEHRAEVIFTLPVLLAGLAIFISKVFEVVATYPK